MNVATTLSEFRAKRARLEEPVGFVPTMGYLHEGHLSLARLARSSCESVIVKLFNIVQPQRAFFGQKDAQQALVISQDEGLKALLPLVRGTVENLETVGLPNALTGPIARGDVGTINSAAADRIRSTLDAQNGGNEA